MQQPGEPSVEEILQSIKKVISRDGVELDARRPTLRRSAAPEPIDAAPELGDEEVLELAPDTMIAFAEDETSAMEHDNSWSDEDEHALPTELEESATPADDEPLTGETTRSAMRENLAALAMLAQPGAQPRIVRSGETSLEQLTRELLRPMLAKWLDEHLPPMVEDLVKAEIARIAGKRG